MNRKDLLEAAAALHRQGRLDEAERVYESVLSAQPKDPDALHLTGLIRYQRGNYQGAVERIERAMKCGAGGTAVLLNLGASYRAAGQLSDAIKQYRAALKLDPRSADAHNNLANALEVVGYIDEAHEHFKLALSFGKSGAVHSNYLYGLNLRADLPREHVAAEHRAWGDSLKPLARGGHDNVREESRKLRVGYVSADLRIHSVTFFLGPLLEAHDRNEVEVVCYSAGVRFDAMTERLRSLSSEWVDISGMTDEQAAERIRADRIDVLVDLSGHTGGNRLGVFARTPAPVLVSWLGYPNTTGLSAMNYRICDALSDPKGPTDADYTETLVRLDGGFLCFEPWASSPSVAPSPCTTTSGFTFGSFNNLAKVTPEVLALWSRVLEAVPDATLMLKATPFGDPGIRTLYESRFKKLGIPARRLRLVREEPSVDGHLSRYAEVDVALDTFPYCGTTTTFEALWMGVPVVSLVGDRHASRVGFDILTRLGLPELAASTPEAYVECARQLAQDRVKLSELRAGIRNRLGASTLCDRTRFARELEAAYRSMWRTWCAPSP